MPHTRHPSSQRDPRVRSLLKLSTSSASWPRSLPGIYMYTPLLSPLLSRASLPTMSFSLSLVSPSRFSPEHPPRVGGSCHVHSIFYFLYRVATSLNVSFCDVYADVYRSRWCLVVCAGDRLVSIIIYGGCVMRYTWMEVDWDTYMMVLWWIQVRVDLREVVEQLSFLCLEWVSK